MSVNRSQSIPPGAPVDLTNCDREPIHTPGAIQAHGALFALDPVTLRILAASDNAQTFTGVALGRTINARAEDVFARDAVDRIAALASDPVLVAGAATFAYSDAYAARLHSAGETLYVELEPTASGGGAAAAASRDAAAARFDVDDDIVRVCDGAASAVREMTGYDRVMIYRFDPDGHGSVIAEAREPRLNTFLGQHYPASDIPRQARELYRTTMLRLIVDVGYVPAPVSPLLDPKSAKPWDLGRAILRSVSPIHIQYLKNMGVSATLTVSLLRDGELWGLIAAHHYSPKYVGHELRDAVESLGYALVDRIVALEDGASRERASRLEAALSAFVAKSGEDRVASVATDAELHRALGWSGAAYANGSIVSAGAVPGDERLAALVFWLDERSGPELFVTDNLARLNPDFADVASLASGVYAFRTGSGWLFGFRPEFEHEIVWGGDPSKPAAFDGERLSPRGSFEQWREEVRERAVPWEPEVLTSLERLMAWMDHKTPWS